MLRTGIVGLGSVAAWHRRGLERTPGATLTAVADVDGRRAERVGDEWGVSAYEDAESLRRAEDLDWVHVCTPVGTHAAVAEPFLRAGVHALVEKPFAESRAAYESIRAAADEGGVRATVVHNQVYYAPVQTALGWIDGGRFGRLHGVSVRWLENNDPREPDRGDWVLELPGGEFGEGIVHPIYVGLRAAGYPADESAVHLEAINTTGDDDVEYDGICLAFRSEAGVACTVQHHSNTPGSRQLEFFAERGRVVVDIPTQSVQYYPRGYGANATSSYPMASAAYWSARNAARAIRATATAYARRAAARLRGGTYEVHDTHTPVIRREAAAIAGTGTGPTPTEEADWTNRIFTRINDRYAGPDGG